MPLTPEQEEAEHEQRMRAMKADVDLKEAQTLKSKQDWRSDPTRVVIQAFLAGAAILGAAGTVFGYLLARGR